MALVWSGRQCVSIPSFTSRRQLSCLISTSDVRTPSPRGGVLVRHGQKNSWLMNYTLEELFFSAKGGYNSFKNAAAGKGAASMRERDLLVFHDTKAAKLSKYALPGINVPESVMRYPKELSDEEFEATNKRIEPKEEKDIVMIDIENPEDLRRYKWLNRFGTYYMPTTRHPKIIEKRVPTYYPGSKAIEPVKEVVVMKKGAGFTGGIRAGQTLGPPENKHISVDVAQDFQSVLLDIRKVSHSRPTGRKLNARAVVGVGNGNGLVGYETATASDMRKAARKARNKAITRLYHVELCDNHTIYRNMDVRRGRTRMFFHRKETGYGVHCHRVARALCRLAGVKDVHAKVRGSASPISVVGCTLKALTGQLNHEEFAEQTGKHIVEMRREFGYRPVVVASPKASVNKPSPLLKMTKQPYTGVVPLPYEQLLRTWHTAQQPADFIQEEKGKEILAEHAASGVDF